MIFPKASLIGSVRRRASNACTQAGALVMMTMSSAGSKTKVTEPPSAAGPSVEAVPNRDRDPPGHVGPVARAVPHAVHTGPEGTVRSGVVDHRGLQVPRGMEGSPPGAVVKVRD